MADNEILENENLENQEEINNTEEKSEVEILTDELKAKNDAYLRLLAEYDNFRKRSVREKDQTYKSAVSFCAKQMLSVLDTLEIAFNGIEEDSAHKKGIELTLKQLETAFEKIGITRILDEVGSPFDANLHSAVMHVEDENLAENVIAETFQKGFKIGDDVIRHSTVKVAN